MQIQCYGSESTDYLARVRSKEAQTMRTSDAILSEFNRSGGNTPLVAKTPPTFIDKAEGVFNKVWGILSLPNAAASPERKTVTVAAPPVPFAAIAAVGVLAITLYKVGK